MCVRLPVSCISSRLVGVGIARPHNSFIRAIQGLGESRDSSGHLTTSPAAAILPPVMAFFLHRQLHQQMITSSLIAIGIVLIFLFEASLVFAWKNTDTKNTCNQDYEFHHVTILNVTEEASVLLDGCVLSKATVSFHFLSQLGQVVQAQ